MKTLNQFLENAQPVEGEVVQEKAVGAVVKQLARIGAKKLKSKKVQKAIYKKGKEVAKKVGSAGLEGAVDGAAERVKEVGHDTTRNIGKKKKVDEGLMTMLGKKKKEEKKPEKAMDAGARAKRKLARKVHAKYVSGSEDNVPSDIEEAKVDTGKSPEEKEKVRNVRKFGVSHNVAGHGKLRRALHRSDRGDKKIKGDKSAYVEMESVIDENRMAAYTAGAGEGSPASRPRVSQKTADMVGRRMDKDAFGDRKKKEGIRLSPTKKYSGKDKGKVVKRANTTGRGTPTQYRKSHEDPDMGRYQQKVTQGRSSVKDLRKEDKAFNYVLAKLKAKHGDGVLTKRDKIKPQSAAEKAKVRAHQAKIDKENAAERAKDPSQGRYPKG